MRLELNFVALLVPGFLLTSILCDVECPLKFKNYTDAEFYHCDRRIDAPACCVNAFVSFTQALAYHTNTTNGQPLFLNRTLQSACAGEIESTITLDTKHCSFQPPRFTAYSTPCTFGFHSELRRALLAVNTIRLDDLVNTCANVEDKAGCSQCRQQFYFTRSILAHQLKDSDVTCGLALLVSLASHNVTERSWLDRLYWCVDDHFAAANIYTGRSNSNMTIMVFLVTFLGMIPVLGLAVILIHLRKKYVKQFNHKGSEGGQEVQDLDDLEEHAKKLGYDGPLVSQGSLYTFSSKELTKATDSFSIKNFIGEGSAGKVFKGALPSGQLVAIKHIMNEKKLDTFYKEVENLSKVRHTNLVTLLGYCQTPNEHLLVYEYCSKGNLWHYLFGKGPVLTWEQRINIAVGSARGIWYLHLYPGGHIVHRDIKPTNILLNEHMEAKVSDFGLSRFIAMEESRVFTEVKGTAGYLDPEYLQQGTLTFASDVYSFGIVLLELISGRRPIELSLNLTKRLPLVKLANLVVDGGEHLSQLVDPRLEGCYSETAFMRMTEIAVHCTSNRSELRPTMTDVLQGLEEAWRLARLESPPQRSFQRIPTTASGSWSPLSLSTPSDADVWESRSSFDVWESRTFDALSATENKGR